MQNNRLGPLLENLDALLPTLEATYKDIHSHPELSMQETRTAGIAENHLKTLGFEVTAGGRQDRSCRLVTHYATATVLP